ncbi:DNA annealing helicase and endonuclease ZRANB3 isoform X1 [Cuculus canorus]|uniref:DNA annealing helicase and endonuclease ZRANB3 isoform X1 n=2 Tax=Cuculus canorus TaxID=55661 RepID=UPI0023AAD691|nr:DNA annealing helicase and endonuclease ZRANB3 isoform X1 [Cuculus canorus]XP_053926734.1 DNA annealing helicase and endonuclease ZRANB3 isoform X1 [Cuculus canorus]XP_053926735.1 DNA annealing helicase and endonuclease ZRANB3 isoform X1 [Cuculus canorus]XP_053926736.1 DNA annealing helicase and endonuclease ZRANB3 isoform X1 [Cuculus canorus]
MNTPESPSSENVDAKLSFLPERLRKKLLAFQEKGIIFALQRHGRCMIADEMGLGKTIQAIAISYYYKSEWPLLIVVPSSLRYPWVEEMEKWIPELSPDDISIIQNKTDTGRISTSKVTILGYGLLTSDAQTLVDTLYRQNFKVVVVDESHYMKSRNATRSRILLPIVQKALRAILLTGTPALGRPEELFMQIEALFPRRFGTWNEYAKKYCNARVRFFGKRTHWDCRGASNLEELHELLSEIMIRRLKNDVLTQLPPKVRQRIPFDLPQAAAKNLNATFAEWEKLMRNLNSDATESHFSQVMNLITRMYKETAIAKAGAVKDYIKMMLENDKLKFLVFAHHLSMLQACTEAVIENKVRYIRIDGSVPSAERVHLVNQFQKDPDTRVAILSIQAAGQGLTFTAATHVVFAELYWDPGHIKQAEDRAHRIGQCSSVNIHFLIAKGTMDTLMWAMLNRKAKVTGSTLNGRKEKMQAEEGDKEKWDFLSFAETWTPNESLEDSKNELLFTHFEKERQHDIRSFFSPKSSTEKKRKISCGNESLHNDSESFEIIKEEDGDMSNENLNCTIISDVDTICHDSTCEREAKRARSINGSTPVSCSKKKKKSLTGKKPSLFSEENNKIPPCGFNTSSKSTALNKVWHCSVCTYSNNELLPYCEMCNCPQSSNAGRNGEAPSSQAEEDVSGDSRRNEERAACSAEERREEMGGTQRSVDISEQENVGIENEEGEKKRGEGDADKSDTFPIYEGLLFCASRNTDRIHLYTKDGEALNHNFVPLDIQLDNWEDLPEAFQHKQNRSSILRFVKEWSRLTAMKQKIVRKSGQLFCSPIQAAEELSKKQAAGSSTKRYVTKEDVAAASLSKASSSGGSVRLISKDGGVCVKSVSASVEQLGHPTKLLSENGKDQSVLPSDQMEAEGSCQSKGYLQALDSQGNPLCLSCQQPTARLDPGCQARAWDTRFCSHACQEDFSIRSSQSYLRTKVFEVEHGVCQFCHQNAQELYLSIRDAPKSQRKKLLESSWMSHLPLGQLNEMITNPTEGQFWQVDHIQPVYDGGGQCSLENLQTLCTLCHRERTAKQAKERSQVKRRSLATKYGCDITKFFVKM